MASNNNDWNSFMQSKQARVLLNGLCAVICAVYAVDAARELLGGGSPELIAQVGSTAYYALTIARGLVCVWVSLVFGRMTYKTIMEREEDR